MVLVLDLNVHLKKEGKFETYPYLLITNFNDLIKVVDELIYKIVISVDADSYGFDFLDDIFKVSLCQIRQVLAELAIDDYE